MKTISFVMRKGGQGKTTLCDEIGNVLQTKGYTVEVTDLDDQQGSYLVSNVDDGKDPDFLLIDTRGALDTGIELDGQVLSVADVVESSDLVVIPCMLEADAKRELPKAVRLCEEKDVPYLIVANRVDFRRVVDREIFKEICREYADHVAHTLVVQSSHISQARFARSYSPEVDKRSKGAQSIFALVDEILEVI